MADEYIAELGFDSGRAIKAIDDVLSRLGRLESKFSGMEKTVSRASKPLIQTQQALAGVAKSADQAGSAVDRQIAKASRSSTAWKELAKSLALASAQYRQFRREKAAGDGSKGKDVYAYRLSSLKKYVATYEAQTADFISAARKRIAVEDEIAQRAKQSNTTQTNIRAQDAAVSELTAKLEKAAVAYETFNKAQVVGGGGGRGLASYGSKELQGLVSSAQATGQTSKFIRDAEQRLKAEADLIRRASASGISVDALKKEDAQIDALVADLRKAETAYEQFNRAKLTGGKGGRDVASYSQADLQKFAATGAATGQSSAFLTDANKRIVGLNKGLDDGTRNLARLRYAAYDVSFVLGAMGVGGLAAATAVERTAIEYDKLFASVQRTSDIDFSNPQGTAQLAELRKELVGLTEQLPLTFDEVSQIATLGNQLGIPSAQIVSFTSTVAKFSASSNVTVEEAATAFGRLGQILHDTNYTQMGDDIAYLGVKSVATESQIIGVAQQIAVSTQLAGYSTKQTLALSAALASLGVKQEQSRGTFIRVFGAIGAAVNGGGQRLNDLNAISKTASGDFASDWKDNASGAFSDFVKGLGTNKGEIKSTLAQFGITAVRDVQTIQLLAQNQDVLQRATNDTAKSNGYLNKSYGVVQATIASKMTVLGNTVKATFDEIGSSANGAVGFFVDLVGVLAKVEAFVASNPFTAIGAAVGVLLLGLLSLGAIGGAALIRLYGNYLALETAFVETDAAQTKFGAGVGRLLGLTSASTGTTSAHTAAMQKDAAATAEAAVATDGLVAARRAEAGATGAANIAQDATALDAVTKSTRGASSGFNSMLGTLSKVAGAIGLAGLILQLPAVVEGLHQIQIQAAGLVPDVDSLTRSVHGLNTEAKELAQTNLKQALGALGTGTAVPNTLSGLGVDAKGNARDPLAIPGIAGTGTPGYKPTKSINAGRAAVNFLTSNTNALPGESVAPTADVSTAITEIKNYDTLLAQLQSSGDQDGFNAALKIFHQQMHQAGVESDYADQALIQTNAALKATSGLSLDGAAKLAAFGDTIDSAFDSGTQAQQLASDLGALGSALGSGDQLAASGSQMVAILKDIGAAASSPEEAAGQVLGLGNALFKAGLIGSQGLEMLRGVAQQLSPDAKATAFDISAVSKAIDATTTSAEKSKRTLSDYASDLGGVFQRAYDLRFGNQTSLDKISQGWIDAKAAIKDAREELKKAKADLAALTNDRSDTKYLLDIATKYGDNAQAASLRAKLQQQDADIAAKKGDIRDDQTKTSRDLTGNGAGAIKNRADLQGQIQNSQSYIQGLAANGATQGQLNEAIAAQKRQFIDQATAAGFSRKEVVKLAASFDDMKKSVEQVPRKVDIGVSANLSPAQNAINEFLAAAAKVKVDIPVSVTPTAADTATITIGGGSQAPFLDGQKPTPVGQPVPDYFKAQKPVASATGAQGVPDYLKVKPAAPRQMTDSANRGVGPVSSKTTVKAYSPDAITASLSRTDRQLLAQAGRPAPIQISAGRVADAVGSVNQQSYRRGGN